MAVCLAIIAIRLSVAYFLLENRDTCRLTDFILKSLEHLCLVAGVEPLARLRIVLVSSRATNRGRPPDLAVWDLAVEHPRAILAQVDLQDALLDSETSDSSSISSTPSIHVMTSSSVSSASSRNRFSSSELIAGEPASPSSEAVEYHAARVAPTKRTGDFECTIDRAIGAATARCLVCARTARSDRDRERVMEDAMMHWSFWMENVATSSLATFILAWHHWKYRFMTNQR